MNAQTLVIAYGNRLRGDDGVGPATGDTIQSWQLPGVKVLIVPQLLPELVDEMTDADRILFVDAVSNADDRAYASILVEPRKTRRALGHHDTPTNLMALLRDLEGRAPEAWLLTISACSFDHGEQITGIAAGNMQAALAWIRRWLNADLPSRQREY
jgi:hydrogenase maturation protease